MKCAVAIVLALISLSLVHPAPSGLGGLALLAPVEARFTFINHGISIPRIPIVVPIKPIIEPIIKYPVIPIVKPYLI